MACAQEATLHKKTEEDAVEEGDKETAEEGDKETNAKREEE